MAMRLQVSDEILARLGRPTVEGLAARLVELALYLHTSSLCSVSTFGQ
ncbi:MAG: hypothetical protein ACRDP6_16560 [Actinoallomurus sp.]